MAPRFFLSSFLLAVTLAAAIAQRPDAVRIEIDLQDQMAYLLENGQVTVASPISSGRAGYQTTRGSFKIIEKERNHYSTLYGKIVDARGNTILADADTYMPVSRVARFVPAPMRYFIRFNGAEGMHAGHLPGYAASHGCVRLPEANAIAIFEAADVGTPVTVFGTTPVRRVQRNLGVTTQRRRQQPTARGFDPRLDPRYFLAPPGWWQ